MITVGWPIKRAPTPWTTTEHFLMLLEHFPDFADTYLDYRVRNLIKQKIRVTIPAPQPYT